MTVEALKEAIAGLPKDERHSLALWLTELDYDDWDRELVRDFASGGPGQQLLDRVKHEVAAGKAIPFRVSKPRS